MIAHHTGSPCLGNYCITCDAGDCFSLLLLCFILCLLRLISFKLPIAIILIYNVTADVMNHRNSIF